MKRLMFAALLAMVGSVQAANPRLLVVSQRNGPNISVYGTNKYLFQDGGGMGPDLPQEIIPSAPPYLLPDGGLGTLAQPFGPTARKTSVYSTNMFLDDGIYHDVVAIGEGKNTNGDARVRIYINTASIDALGVYEGVVGTLVGRAERDAFIPIVEFDVGAELPGASLDGLNVAVGDFDYDPATLEVAVSRQKGNVDVAIYSVAVGTPPVPLTPPGALTVTPVYQFFAYPSVPANYNGGVRLATSKFVPSVLIEAALAGIGGVDVEDILFKERLITAPGAGYKPWVKCWDVDTLDTLGLISAFGGPWVMNEFLAFGPKFKGGVNLCSSEELLEGLLGLISFIAIPDQLPEGLFPCVIATQSSGGGTANFYYPNYISGEWIKSGSIKPFGASYTGGLAATVSDINLRGIACKVGFTGQGSNTGFRWYAIDVFTQFLNGNDFRLGLTELPLYRFKPAFGPPLGPKSTSATQRYTISP